jgi:hypothetical protein
MRWRPLRSWPSRQKIQVVGEGEYLFVRFRYQLDDEVMATLVGKFTHMPRPQATVPMRSRARLPAPPTTPPAPPPRPCSRTGCGDLFSSTTHAKARTPGSLGLRSNGLSTA